MIKAKHLSKNRKKIVLSIVVTFLIIFLLEAATLLHSSYTAEAVTSNNDLNNTENLDSKDIDMPVLNRKSIDYDKLITVHNPSVNMDGSSFPESWNSEKQGLVPNKLRNQGSYGTCWEFGPMAAIESSAITRGISQKGRDIDLSERQNLYFDSNNENIADHLDLITKDYTELIDPTDRTKKACKVYLNTGGWGIWVAMSLFTWCGPCNEELAPYNILNDWESKQDLSNIAFVNRLLHYGPDGEQGWKARGYDMTWEQMNNTFLNLLKKQNLNKELAFDNDAYHLQDFSMIPYLNENKSINFDGIKDEIMKNGAVSCDYRDTQSRYDNYNEENNCYYCPDASESNHEVAIVGWDDNFSADKFTKKPPANGAWLIRNSWTVSPDASGDYNHRGYFWISYYNGSFLLPNEYFSAFVPESSNNYDNNYQYDGNIDLSTIETNENADCVANEFQAKAINNGCEQLNAVALGVINNNTNFDLQIYKDIQNPSDPTSGTKCLSEPQHVHFNYGGYHTVKLNTPIYIDEGSRYSIVFKCTDKDSKANLFIGSTISDEFYHLHEYTLQNQSFMLQNGTWTDMNNQGSCFRIKAYTNNKVKLVYSGEITNTVYLNPNTKIDLPVCPEPNYKYIFTINGKEITDSSLTVDKNIQIDVSKKYVGPGGDISPVNTNGSISNNSAQTGDINLNFIMLLTIIAIISGLTMIVGYIYANKNRILKR